MEKLCIEVGEAGRTTAHIYKAARANRVGVTLLLGHGAGAGQSSGFLVSFASALAKRGIDAVTFNFLYTEQGRKAPDRNDLLQTCYLAAIRSAANYAELGGNRLAIGGKSMGGRIASQVAALPAEETQDLAGLVFLGYPLHPPGRPYQMRDRHLPLIRKPMLFVQGSRDVFGTPAELQPVLKRLIPPGTLFVIEGGDHSFKVPKQSPLTQEQVYMLAQDEIVRWLQAIQ